MTKPTPSPDSLTILTAHVADTLPDSIEARRKVLLALKSVMTARHPAMKWVDHKLALIQQMQEAQIALSAEFAALIKGGAK